MNRKGPINGPHNTSLINPDITRMSWSTFLTYNFLQIIATLSEAFSMGTTPNFPCRLLKQSRTFLSWRIGLVCWNLNFTIEGCVCYFDQILHLKDGTTRKSNLTYNLQPLLSSSCSISISFLLVRQPHLKPSPHMSF